MKTLLLCQFFADLSPGGNLYASLAEDRLKRGDEVTVITSSCNYGSTTTANKCDYNIQDAHIHRVWSPVFNRNSIISRLISYGSYYVATIWHAIFLPPQDRIVVTTTPPYIVFSALFHKLLNPKVKIVLWCMDVYPDVMEVTGFIKKGGILSRLLRALNRLYMRHIDYLICLDEAMEQRVLAQYSASTTQLKHSVIPTWENSECFPHTSEERAFGPFTNNNPLIVLYTGNAGWGHEFSSVIYAACELHDKPIEFHFTGGGKSIKWITSQIEKKHLSNIHFHGYVSHSNLLIWLTKAHLGLVTLRNDCAGIMSPSKICSYLAMGLPLLYIGPKHTNVDDAICNYNCGYSFSNKDRDYSLITFLRKCLTDPNLLISLSDNAIHSFSKYYSSAVCLDSINSIVFNDQ